MIEEILKSAKEQMKKSIDNLKHEFGVIRTGRATSSLLDTVKVEYYGSIVSIKELASITAPQPNLLLVRPWDKSSIKEIEKGILKAGLGLTPNIDGETIKIPIPSLSEERREELIKIVRKTAEEERITIRNYRREAKEKIEEMKKNGEIPEDNAFREEKELQKITDECIEEVNNLLKIKEEEIRKV